MDRSHMTQREGDSASEVVWIDDRGSVVRLLCSSAVDSSTVPSALRARLTSSVSSRPGGFRRPGDSNYGPFHEAVRNSRASARATDGTRESANWR